jgi:hypothetical protein
MESTKISQYCWRAVTQSIAIFSARLVEQPAVTFVLHIFSVIFVCLYVAVQVECFVDLIKLAIVFRVTIWTLLRQVTDYAHVLRLSPLLCANNMQPFARRHKTTQKILLCISVPFQKSKCKLLKSRWYFEGRELVSCLCNSWWLDRAFM